MEFAGGGREVKARPAVTWRLPESWRIALPNLILAVLQRGTTDTQFVHRETTSLIPLWGAPSSKRLDESAFDPDGNSFRATDCV